METSYALDLTDTAWLEAVNAAARPLLDEGLGITTYTYRFHADGSLDLSGFVSLGLSDGLEPLVRSWLAFTDAGALRPGKHTARAAADKFITREATTEDKVWWGEYNRPFTPPNFNTLLTRLQGYLQGRDVFVQDCFAGADPEHRLPVRVITEKAWHSLFARTMLLKPKNLDGYKKHVPEFTVICADPNRLLIGDDEHGWSDSGVFNFEDGCYAKVIRLSPQAEPEIHATTRRFGTILENVTIDRVTRRLDLNDASVTENTRGAYPLAFIDNALPEKRAGHPSNIIFLTCDASGVLPPISRLSPEQAMFHFISGYTSKFAGTEVGLGIEPEITFSTCFGAPFMVQRPLVYAELLRSKMLQHHTSCWLKVRIEATDLSTFPDVTVVCRERLVASNDRNAVTNPTLIVEVTSDSTEDYDRGEKLSHYKQCPTVQAVLLISHRRPQITLVTRASNGWMQSEHRAGERVDLPSPQLSLDVDELYAGIRLENAG